MKKFVFVFILFSFIAGADLVSADVLELRGRGYVNGKVLSDDGKTIQFQSAGGPIETLKKSDVLFREGDLRTVAKKQSADWSFLKNPAQWWEKSKHFASETIESLKNKYPEYAKKVEDLFKPINNRDTKAQRQANQFARAIDQASEASLAMNKKAFNANREMKKLDI